MGVGVAVGSTGVFVGAGWVSVGDGVREGGSAVADAAAGATVGVPHATSKLSNTPMIKQLVRRGLRRLAYLSPGERI
jgi:hypothetical protein